jgi:NAD(P)-dependent dehydrogenase (short-subunit alcohol dehydrogenase family)
MTSIHKVAIITGASQGIGAALVTAYRELGYAVVANSRSIGKSDDPDVLTLPATWPRRALAPTSWPRLWIASGGRHRRQQCRNLHRQAVHRLHRFPALT